jgi:hypothetical protein
MTTNLNPVFAIVHSEGKEVGVGRNTLQSAIEQCAKFCYEYGRDNIDIISAGFALGDNPPIQSWDHAGLSRIKKYIAESLEEYKEKAEEEKEGREAIERDFYEAR